MPWCESESQPICDRFECFTTQNSFCHADTGFAYALKVFHDPLVFPTIADFGSHRTATRSSGMNTVLRGIASLNEEMASVQAALFQKADDRTPIVTQVTTNLLDFDASNPNLIMQNLDSRVLGVLNGLPPK